MACVRMARKNRESIIFLFFFNPRVANKIIRYRQEDIGCVHCESVVL